MTNITGTEKQVAFASAIIDRLARIELIDCDPEERSQRAVRAMQQNKHRVSLIATAKVLRALIDQGPEAAEKAFEEHDAAYEDVIRAVTGPDLSVRACDVIDRLKTHFYASQKKGES